MWLSAWFIKKHPSDTEYPEGDQLLMDWQTDDAQQHIQENMSSIPLKSVFDYLDEQNPPTQNSELSGGFMIDNNAFDEVDKDET